MLEKTKIALQVLSEELYASNADVLLTISTQRDLHQQAFALNLHDSYSIDLSDFGEYKNQELFKPDLEFATNIQRAMKKAPFGFTMESNRALDYGVGVPLLLLQAFPKNKTIVPITYSHLSSKHHVEFGRMLKDICLHSKKRIAIIASGDLSHTLSSSGPAEFHPSGQEVDQLILQSVEHMSLSKLLSIDKKRLEESEECAHRPLLILFGILEKMHVRPEILSYEHPFGVGELVVQFHLPQ